MRGWEGFVVMSTAMREEGVEMVCREDSGYTNRPSVEVGFVSTSFVRLKFGHKHQVSHWT